MNYSKTRHWKRLLVLPLMICLCHDVQARPNINDILTVGSKWTLNVNGEQGTLTLIRGKGGPHAKGGFIARFQVDFAGHKGYLRGLSNAENTTQSVTLEVTRKNGIKATCHGFIAQETDKFMAGSCDEKVASGAWYATRQTAKEPSSLSCKEQGYPSKKQLALCEAQKQKYRREMSATKVQNVNARKNLDNAIDKLKSCEKKLQNLSKGTGKTTVKPFSNIKNRVGGQYSAGKGDMAQYLDFPTAPSPATSDEAWFKRLNAELLNTVKLGFHGGELHAFQNLENSQCNGKTVFCRIAVRQQALYFMLGGK